MTALRIGTRGSALALAQTGHVADALRELGGFDIAIVPIQSEGDRVSVPLASLGGTGIFATALRMALLADRCDLVVHSFKDLPTEPFAGLAVGAVPKRHDSRDALVARRGWTLADLPQGARVGTGSPRRVAALLALRPDLDVQEIRGNIDSRMQRIRRGGDLDAVVLAAAGIQRLGRVDAITEYFEFDAMPQAPAQGALAVEVRADRLGEDSPIVRALAELDDPASRYSAEAERAVLRRLEAGCAAPVGAQAIVRRSGITVRATVYSPDGQRSLRREVTQPLPEPHGPSAMRDTARSAGIEVARQLLEGGAADLAPLQGELR